MSGEREVLQDNPVVDTLRVIANMDDGTYPVLSSLRSKVGKVQQGKEFFTKAVTNSAVSCLHSYPHSDSSPAFGFADSRSSWLTDAQLVGEPAHYDVQVRRREHNEGEGRCTQ